MLHLTTEQHLEKKTRAHRLSHGALFMPARGVELDTLPAPIPSCVGSAAL